MQLIVRGWAGIDMPLVLSNHRVQLAVNIFPFANTANIDKVLPQKLLILAVGKFVGAGTARSRLLRFFAPRLDDPEQILPAVLINKVPAGMAGLLIVAMLAAMKGSLAGVINGASAYFVKDIYQTVWRPKASNRELIAASWLSTMAMMGVGLAMGLSASSINNIWGWLMMSLTAGSLAPAALRLYWWRCNGWGVAGGLVLGSVGALVQRFAWPDMVEWQQFLFMTGLSFLGTVGGSLLTAPTPLETLRHFYRTTRPFGWWRPLWNELEPGERAAWRKEHRNDILTVPFALLWQVTLFLLPMQLVIKSYDAFWKTLPFFLLALGGMYWFWWRNLPPARSQEENATGMGMKQ